MQNTESNTSETNTTRPDFSEYYQAEPANPNRDRILVISDKNIAEYKGKSLIHNGSVVISLSGSLDDLHDGAGQFCFEEVKINGDLKVKGSLTITSDLLCSGSAYVSGSVSAMNAVCFSNFYAKDYLHVSETIYVSGNLFCEDGINSGEIGSRDESAMRAHIYVEGCLSARKDIRSAGAIIADRIRAGGNVHSVRSNIISAEEINCLGNIVSGGLIISRSISTPKYIFAGVEMESIPDTLGGGEIRAHVIQGTPIAGKVVFPYVSISSQLRTMSEMIRERDCLKEKFDSVFVEQQAVDNQPETI